jgi:hypothetical protein
LILACASAIFATPTASRPRWKWRFSRRNGKHLNCRRQRQPWIEFLDEHPWTRK